jgi:hypothetical protein
MPRPSIQALCGPMNARFVYVWQIEKILKPDYLTILCNLVNTQFGVIAIDG